MTTTFEEGVEYEDFLDDTYERAPEASDGAVEDEALANWALRKIAAARAELARKQQVAAGEAARVETWLAGETRRLQDRIDYFTGRLLVYHRPLFDADPKHNRTIKLPCGTLQFRKPPARFERDEGVLLTWLENQSLDEFIRDKREVEWAKLKSQCQVAGDKLILKSTGELVGGVKVLEDPPQFKVTTEDRREESA
ncbi:MAG TPA: host-nuclease inhibitor Gam family protein [Bacillota bacterium]|nr:host-nuclease inhibitor Gam family protein [Bacillota bacterium]